MQLTCELMYAVGVASSALVAHNGAAKRACTAWVLLKAATCCHTCSRSAHPDAVVVCYFSMAYKGNVVQDPGGNWRFQEEGPNPLQRLSKATINEGYAERLNKEIQLERYANQSISVEGDWEHDWILDATVEDA